MVLILVAPSHRGTWTPSAACSAPPSPVGTPGHPNCTFTLPGLGATDTKG